MIILVLFDIPSFSLLCGQFTWFIFEQSSHGETFVIELLLFENFDDVFVSAYRLLWLWRSFYLPFLRLEESLLMLARSNITGSY